MSNQLATINPAELHRISTDVASVCKEIVIASALEIQGRSFVRVEGYMAIATAHGCIASARDVEKVDGGVRATGEVRRMSDGAILCTAEGFVGEDEPTWYGGEATRKNGETYILPKRADYAIRAMAQTRAISRACRSAFAHVVVMMNAGLSTTPAEEVPDGGFNDRSSSAGAADEPVGLAERRAAAAEGAKKIHGKDASAAQDHWKELRVPFGKSKGMTYGELTDRDLTWHLKRLEEKIEKDGELKYRDDRELLVGLRAHFAPNPESQMDEIPGLEKAKENMETMLAEVIPQFQGPKGEELFNRFRFDGVTLEEFLACLKTKKALKIPAGADTYEVVTEEVAETVLANYAGFIEEIILNRAK